MLSVGLTGSIGVGKSFVTSVFAELGSHVLDADQTAREVVASGTPGLSAVIAAFGNDVLAPDGSLDRGRLGTLVFADEQKRQLLNAILHPFIMAEQDEIMRQWEIEDPQGVGVIDAALMIESGGYKRFDKLVVVHCRPEVQLERLMTRNGLTLDEAKRRVKTQLSQEEKQKFADYLIDTSDGFDETRRRTMEVYKKLLKLSGGGK
jgi:dephospho-CoA kinase